MALKYVFAAADSSDQDRGAASPGCIFNGEAWTQAQKEIISSAKEKEIECRAGTYAYEGTLVIGNNTYFHGPAGSIPIPARKRTLVDHDPRTMAVFRSLPRHQYSTQTMIGGGPKVNGVDVESPTKPSSTKAVIQTQNPGTNIRIADIYLLGYMTLNLPGASNCRVSRVVISNYLAKATAYPNGSWCNMGFNATGAFWQQGSCKNNVFEQCISQFSSHHGFLLLNGGSSSGMKLKDCRALYSGVGMIRCGNGTPTADMAESKGVQALKNAGDHSGGRGYMDWSVAFDLNESGTMDGLEVEDCFAFSAWKVGFYQEPGKINKNVVLRGCVSEEAGRRATITIRTTGGEVVRMIPRESEASNFYLQNAALYGCISRRALKAGYDIFPQSDYTQTIDGTAYRFALVDCSDCGSRYGIACGPCNSGNVLIRRFKSANYGHYAINLSGKTPGTGKYVVQGLKIKVPAERAGRPPLRIGRYCRVNQAMSLSDSQRGKFTSGLSTNCGTMVITVDGVVDGLNAGVAVYTAGPNQPESPSAVTLQRATSATAWTQAEIDALCVATDPAPPGNPEPDPDPDPEPDPEPEIDLPIAAFTGSPTAGIGPLSVQFTDQTEGATAWTWDFGDGQSSTLQNPRHTYTSPGTYPVALHVTVGGLFDSERKAGYIRVFAGGGIGQEPINPGNRVWLLSDPHLEQAHTPDGAIAATITIRIDEGAI